MNTNRNETMEAAALRHAADWIRYQQSPQYASDLKADMARRIKADKSSGHTPACTLSRCSSDCQKGGAR